MTIKQELERLLNLYGDEINLTGRTFLSDRLHWDEKYDRKAIEDLNDEDLDQLTDKIRLLEILEGYQYKECEGGPEKGVAASAIYYFPKVDTYIKFNGDYYSYDGYTYESMHMVTPKDVLVTKYFPE